MNSLKFKCLNKGLLSDSDEEKRLLRIKVSQLEPALEKQRQKRRESEKEVRELERELEERRKRIEELEKENDELRRQRDQYRDMLFKKSKKREESKEVEERVIADAHKAEAERKRKRGGQRGHVGKGRKVPVRVDAVVRVHLEQCPDCGNPLKRGKKVTKHTVQDIAPLEKAQTQVVRYETERQWCNHCKKRVKGVCAGVIPGSRLGINVFLYVLMSDASVYVAEYLGDDNKIPGYLFWIKSKCWDGSRYDASGAEMVYAQV
jgi:DNA repair exonuclease SbcCD ATPase subunit